MSGLGAVATVFLSGVVAAVATYMLNSNKEHVFHRRQKAEELFKACHEFGHLLHIHSMWAEMMYNGRISYDDRQDLVIKHGKSDSWRDLNMIGKIYFPELNHMYTELESRRAGLAAIQMRYEQFYRHKGEDKFHNTQAAKEMAEAHVAVNNFFTKLEEEVIACAAAIAATDALLPAWLNRIPAKLKLRWMRSTPP